MISNPKLTSQELYIYKKYILQEIAQAFNQYGKVAPKDLEQILDIDVEVSDVTELIYPLIQFNIDAYTSYKSLDKFNLIDKPNDLFDKYELITVSVPLRRIVTPSPVVYYLTPYSSKDEVTNFNKQLLKKENNLFSERNKEITILTNGDKETIDFVGEEYSLIIDYTKQHQKDLIQYRNKINELLLDIFKKLKPINADKLTMLVKKHYN